MKNKSVGMRTHLLRDLDIPGSKSALVHVPDLDFYRLGLVKYFCLTTSELNPNGYDFELSAAYSAETRSFTVVFRFVDVRLVRLPELGPSFHLSELEIEDLARDQLEGIRYRAKDYGQSQFEVLCKEMAIDCVLAKLRCSRRPNAKGTVRHYSAKRADTRTG
jgi:hypothetical protein